MFVYAGRFAYSSIGSHMAVRSEHVEWSFAQFPPRRGLRISDRRFRAVRVSATDRFSFRSRGDLGDIRPKFLETDWGGRPQGVWRRRIPAFERGAGITPPLCLPQGGAVPFLCSISPSAPSSPKSRLGRVAGLRIGTAVRILIRLIYRSANSPRHSPSRPLTHRHQPTH